MSANKTSCPNFIRKIGGYYYGFRCKVFHNGQFDLYSHGNRLEHSDRSAKFDKEGRDQYVNSVCKCDYKECGLYKE